MLVALVGVTGVGKSFFKNLIVKELGFKNLPIVTTREMRNGEVNGIDKEFVTDEEFERMKQSGMIQVDFEFLGFKYGYRKEHLQSQENQVTEVYYSSIYQLKKCVPNLFSIYMFPDDLERAKLELRKRNISEEVCRRRLKEIDEQIQEYENNEALQQQFDCVVVNDYTENSNKKIIQIVKNEIEKGMTNE